MEGRREGAAFFVVLSWRLLTPSPSFPPFRSPSLRSAASIFSLCPLAECGKESCRLCKKDKHQGKECEKVGREGGREGGREEEKKGRFEKGWREGRRG